MALVEFILQILIFLRKNASKALVKAETMQIKTKLALFLYLKAAKTATNK